MLEALALIRMPLIPKALGRQLVDRFGLLAALATLGSHAQLAAYFSESGSTFGDGFPDLAIGYGFAEADVHGGGLKLICCEH